MQLGTSCLALSAVSGGGERSRASNIIPARYISSECYRRRARLSEEKCRERSRRAPHLGPSAFQARHHLIRARPVNLAGSRRNAPALAAREFIVYEIVFACSRLAQFTVTL